MIFKKKKKYRKAVFIVTYSINQGKIEYVILKRKKHWKGFEFPKGKIEKFETKKRTVKREVMEETGLEVLKIKKFKEKGKYKYNKELIDRPVNKGQTYHLFASKVKKGNGKIKVDKKEHYSGEWLDYKNALKKLTWKNQKKCLKIVNSWLEKKL